MKRYAHLLLGFCIMILLDFIWLGILMNQLFTEQIYSITNDVQQFSWVAALGVYLVMLFGLQYFVLRNIPKRMKMGDVYIQGAFFGAVIYAIYDLTNMAIFQNWHLQTAVLDIAWGCFLLGTTTAVMEWWKRKYIIEK